MSSAAKSDAFMARRLRSGRSAPSLPSSPIGGVDDEDGRGGRGGPGGAGGVPDDGGVEPADADEDGAALFFHGCRNW
jgi:hypothetical protein